MRNLFKNFCRLLVLLAIAFVVLGFFRHWFQVSSESTEQTIQVNLTVDKEKLLADKESAQETGRNLYQKALDLTGKGEKETAKPSPAKKETAKPVERSSEEKPAPRDRAESEESPP
jgi:hypothetical protein